jgi:glycosyltransferase involved in cell wall biosynthesis
MPSILIMLPTLDEEEAIENVISRIPSSEIEGMGFDYTLLVVDGGSTDRTLDIATEMGCEIIHQWGEGKGLAIRQAFKKFIEYEYAYLVMLDSDGTYSPEEIPLILKSIPKNGVAIGDRLRGNLQNEAMTSTNWIGNHLLTWLAVALHGRPINDLCSGFWGFSRRAVQLLELNSLRFEIEAEMYTSCANRNIPISHVPITYSKRQGEAKLGSVKDGASIARKLIIRRIFPTPYEENQ